MALSIARNVMLERFRVSNFKILRELDTPLSRITLLGGPNGVGKSSLLEAMFLFFDRYNPEMFLRQFGWRGLARLYLPPDQFFAPSFHNFDLSQAVVLAATVDGADERLSFTFTDQPRNNRVKTRPKKGSSHFRVDETASVVAEVDFTYVDRDGKSQYALTFNSKGEFQLSNGHKRKEERRTAYLAPRLRPPPSEDAERYGQLDVDGKAVEVVDLLKEFDPRIQAISTVFMGQSAVLHADVGRGRKIPVPFLGDGASVLLSMLLGISHCRNGMFLVDDIGAGIHHSALPTFWKLVGTACSRFNTQVVATTHSMECMQAATVGLKSLFEPDFSYVRLDPEQDRITTKVYQYPLFEAAMEGGWELR